MVDLLGRKKRKRRWSSSDRRWLCWKRRNSLALQIERRDEKIRKLTAAAQETSLALKAAEQRLAALRDQGDGGGDWHATATKEPAKSRTLRPREVERLLERLDAVRSPKEDLLSAYVASGSTAAQSLPIEVADLARRAVSDRGGRRLLRPPHLHHRPSAPFPIKKDVTAFASSFRTGPLREMLEIPVLAVAAHAGETLLGLALGRGGISSSRPS